MNTCYKHQRRLAALALTAFLIFGCRASNSPGIRRASGHDPYWTLTWLAVLLATAGLVGISIAGAVRLLRRLERADRPRQAGISPYLREVLRLWPRLALMAMLVFVLQEYAEHYFSHGGHALGMHVFWSGEYALTIPSFALVSLLVSAVAGMFVRTLAVLDAAARRAGVRLLRPPRRTPRPAWRDPRPGMLGTLATPDLGRAPPA